MEDDLFRRLLREWFDIKLVAFEKRLKEDELPEDMIRRDMFAARDFVESIFGGRMLRRRRRKRPV